MLTSVTRTRSPLQRELDSLTKVLGIIAWTAVAFIVGVGLLRGLDLDELLLLGTAMAISAIPTGMPAFVSGLLSLGARQLADAKAVVKNLTDVETLGATSAINTDKTGTLTMNEMMVSTIYSDARLVHRRRPGLPEDRGRSSRSPARRSRTSRGWRSRSSCDSDATVADDGTVVGDPTEAALVVLAAKLGVERVRDAPRLPAARRGAVRLRLQVHGDLPPGDHRRRRVRGRAGQGRPGRRPGPLQRRGRTVQRGAGADRADLRRHRGRQPAHGRGRPARARVRRPAGRRRRAARRWRPIRCR